MSIKYTNYLKKRLISKRGMSQLAGTALAMTAAVGAVIGVSQYFGRAQKAVIRDGVNWQKSYLNEESGNQLGRTAKFMDTDYVKDYTNDVNTTETQEIDDTKVLSQQFRIRGDDSTRQGSFDEYRYNGPAF